MKKFAFVMMAMVSMTFMACGGSTKASEGTNDSDSVAVDTVVVDSVVADSTVADSVAIVSTVAE